MTETDDLALLRMSFDLARYARKNGHPPFGAVVAEAGEILARATSTQTVLGDPTSHAEMNAVRIAQRVASSSRLGASTIYASSEPCAMCAAAIFYSGIGRIVFGFSEPKLRALRNRSSETAGLAIGCREIFARTPRKIAVVGPLMGEEASLVHQDFWPRSTVSSEIDALEMSRQLPTENDQDERLLRATIGIACRARAKGEMPFGATVLGGDGSVLVEAFSTEVSEKDWTCHAETNAVRLVGKMASHVDLGGATIYASSEPCTMCAAAIFYSGIRRIVFGFGETNLRELLGSGETAGLGFSCREILSHAAAPVDIQGPLLEEEAQEPHSGYWAPRRVDP